MSGWLYIIKNGDLYKIGITRKFDNRMRQLKPDKIIAKLHTRQYKQLEKDLHKKYINVRIPQTEYFRLSDFQSREIKQIISDLHYPRSITVELFINLISLLIIIFIFVLIFKSLTINDIKNVLISSLFFMQKISLVLSFLSTFLKSGKYFNLVNELKFRISRFFILLFFSFSIELLLVFYFE